MTSIIPDDDCKIVVMDMLIKPILKSKQRSHTNKDPAGHLSNGTTIILEGMDNMMRELEKRSQYAATVKRNIDIQSAAVSFEHDSNSYASRINERNRCHLQLLLDPVAVELKVRDILEKYTEFGSIKEKECFHCQKKFSERWLH